MTFEHIQELKSYFTERANYFSRIDFPILQKDAQTVLEILANFEETIKLNLDLIARIQILESTAESVETETPLAQEGEENV